MRSPSKKSELAKFLKEKRLEEGLSQQEVGDILGVHGMFVSNFERSICKIPLKYLKTLIDFYKIPRKKIMAILLKDASHHFKSELFEKKG